MWFLPIADDSAKWVHQLLLLRLDTLDEFGGAEMLVEAVGIHLHASAGMGFHQDPSEIAVIGIFTFAGFDVKGCASCSADDLS